MEKQSEPFHGFRVLICMRSLLAVAFLGLGISPLSGQDDWEAALLEAIDPTVWGPFNANAYPWLKTMDFGWVYFEPLPGTGTFWMWNVDLGWMYSSKELFPEAWLPGLSEKIESTGWVLFDLTDSKRYKLFVKSRKIWLTIPRPEFPYNESSYSLELVPLDLRGLSSSWFIPYAAGSTYIGDHYLRISEGDRFGSRFSTYYYNSYDGWFYPWHSKSSFHSGMNILGTGRNYRRARVHVDNEFLVIEWEDLLYGQEPETQRLPID